MKRKDRAETEAVEHRYGDTGSERQSNVLNEAIEKAVYFIGDRTFREGFRALDKRFKIVCIVQDKCIVIKMHIRKKSQGGGYITSAGDIFQVGCTTTERNNAE